MVGWQEMKLGHSPNFRGRFGGGAKPPPHIRRHSRDEAHELTGFAQKAE
jgi:hypothetical protein